MHTSLKEEPYFTVGDVDFVYMGPTTEEGQELAIARLKPYKARIREMIDQGTVFLCTGNSFEIFEDYIEVAEEVPGKGGEGRHIEGIGLFKLHAVRRMMHRYNHLFLGTFQDQTHTTRELIGYKNEFSVTMGDNSHCYAFRGERGFGINPGTNLEGVRSHNFFGTYLIGPILITNPYFAKYLLSLAGVKDPHLAFEKEAMDAYEAKLKRFKDPDCEYSRS